MVWPFLLRYASDIASRGTMADGQLTNESSITPGDDTPQNQSSTETGNDAPQESSKTFTQEDLDRKVAEVLNQQKKKYADYSDLKKKAEKLTELEQAQMSETERLQAERDKALADSAQATERANSQLIRAAIIAEAAKMNFNDPTDAVALVSQSDLTIDDNGNVQGVNEAVKSLAEQRQYLLKNDKQRYLEQFNPSGDTQPQKETDEQRRARLYGGGSQIFTVEQAEQHGGGVVWNEPPPKQ